MTTTMNTAWEKIGAECNTTKIEEALEKTGLAFTVEKRPVYFGPNMKLITKKMATVRTDTEDDLGVVGPNYEVCQNSDAFAFADYISSDLKFTKGGMLYNGLCWVVGEMPSITILGDKFTPVLALQNSFNGKFPLRGNISATLERNGSQVNLAFKGVAAAIRVKHSSYLPGRLAQGREMMAGIAKWMDELKRVAERYAGIKMTKSQVEMLMELLFPIRKDMNEATIASVTEKRKEFVAKYNDSANTQNGNAWGVILAYADYIKTGKAKETKVKWERRFMNSALGANTFGKFLKKLEAVTGTKVI